MRPTKAQAKTKLRNVQYKIELPQKLVDELEPLLKERNLKLEEVVRLYLRSLVTRVVSSKALGLSNEMPFGKYRGEIMEVIIKTDPEYITWCLEHLTSRKLVLTPEALELLFEFIEPEVLTDGED